jgi:hypothetical protein
MATTTTPVVPAGFPEMPAELWAKLPAHLLANLRAKGIWSDVVECAQIMRETLRYLDVTAEHPDEDLPPSQLVDEGWHAFFEHMKAYERYCHARYGRMLYHRPGDPQDATAVTAAASTTLALLRKHGIAHKPRLWDRQANCKKTD